MQFRKLGKTTDFPYFQLGHIQSCDVLRAIADNMYVDNMITGIETSTQADELYKEAKTLFQCASMNLREWALNSSEFLQNIPECD